jgi:hypothetical protein
MSLPAQDRILSKKQRMSEIELSDAIEDAPTVHSSSFVDAVERRRRTLWSSSACGRWGRAPPNGGDGAQGTRPPGMTTTENRRRSRLGAHGLTTRYPL